MPNNTRFSNLDHIGLIVRDLDKAAEHLQSLGIGPFKPLKKTVRYDTKFYGKPVDPDDIKLEVRMANMGSGVKLELIQPLNGGPWREFLETRGGGMHHLAFNVDDVDKEVAKLVEKGTVVIYSVRFQGGGVAAYLETSKLGGLFNVVELVRWSPGMIPE